MHVDLQQFRDEGYLILHNVVPPERLDVMRLAIEWMVDREKVRSAAARQPGDPLGGAWYESAPTATEHEFDRRRDRRCHRLLPRRADLWRQRPAHAAPVTALTGLWCAVQRAD